MTASILIVDDSEVVLSVSSAILEEAGYEVRTQSRANGSLSVVIWERPDLVLLDVNMPNISGDTLARMCTKTAQTTGTRVILYSTMSEEALERLVKQSGAHGYIRKTDSSYNLIKQVRRVLGEPESGTLRAASSGRIRAASSGRIRAASSGDTRGRSSGAETTKASQEPDASVKAPQSTHGVLLVDRDMATLSTMREVVQELGHRSDFALSTKQASDKLRAANPPGVVVVSADMPESGFSELLESALSIDSDYGRRFVVTTEGNPQNVQPRDFSGRVVKKPITADDLGAAIRHLLPS